MMPSARLVGIGLFVAGGLALFAVGLFMIGDRRLMFRTQFHVHADFVQVAALQPGAVVRVSGMDAGEVTDIAIPTSPSGRFSVRMRIRSDLRQLVRTDSVATIQTDGLVGSRFVRVQSGSETAPIVEDEGAIKSREPFDLADVLDQGTATVQNINETIDQLQGSLTAVLLEVGETAKVANRLIASVGGDVEEISRAGRRISVETNRILLDIRAGRGTLGKFVNDDELYQRVTTIARDAQEAVATARQAADGAKAAISRLQSNVAGDDGPVRSIVADLGTTVSSTRDAMSNLAESTEALKRNFLVRGYFEDRGYYDLGALTPADYRRGVLAGKFREPVRIWLAEAVLFERVPPASTQAEPDGDALSAGGRARIDRAMAEMLRYPRDTPIIIEGYALGATRDRRFLRAAGRARLVRDYIVGRYALSPNVVETVALGDDAAGSPSGSGWDGVALAAWVDRRVLQPSEAGK